MQLSKAIDVAVEDHPRQYDGEYVRRSSSPRSIVFEKHGVRDGVSDKERKEECWPKMKRVSLVKKASVISKSRDRSGPRWIVTSLVSCLLCVLTRLRFEQPDCEQVKNM